MAEALEEIKVGGEKEVTGIAVFKLPAPSCPLKILGGGRVSRTVSLGSDSPEMVAAEQALGDLARRLIGILGIFRAQRLA